MKDKVYLFLAKYVFGFIIRLLKVTVRFKLVSPDYLDEMVKQGEGCILVFWHGQMLIPLMYHSGKGIFVLVSQNIDGEIIARILNNLGNDSIRGSSSKDGKKVFSEILNKLKENNVVAITPDGPRGPYRKLKMGAVYIAKKSGCPLIPISVYAKNMKNLKSWDKFIIVKPFTECIISYGEPIYVKEDVEKVRLKKITTEIERKILAQNKEIEEYYIREKLNKISNENIFFNRFISTALLPFSNIYKIILSAREYLYAKKILKSSSLSKFVISIGNLTLGGTGKTPMTMWIADILKKKGFKPAVLTRGFKSTGNNIRIVINDGNTLIDVNNTGDEPMLMAQKMKEIPIIIGKNRYKSGIMAEKKFDPEIFLLDDGFQHLKLERDLNILLLNGDRPFGNGKIFPAGILRESLTSIKRADIIVVTKTDNSSEKIIKEVRNYSKAPVFLMKYRVLCLRRIDEKGIILPEEMPSLKSVAFSGIADHKYFIKTLTNSDIRIIDYIKFADHYNYKKRDLEKIISIFKKSKADIIITTGKDAVKIKESPWKPYPFYYLDIDVEIKDSEKFEKTVIDAVEKKLTNLRNL